MPHISAEEMVNNRFGSRFINEKESTSTSTSTRSDEELPIQVAIPNFLGTSDPVVAMARTVSATSAIVDPSFESIEHNLPNSTLTVNVMDNLSSPSPNRGVKTVITPASPGSTSISTTDNDEFPSSSNSSVSNDVSTSSIEESISPRKKEAGSILTTIYGNSRLSHSPVRAKRRVSQIEDDDDDDEQSTKSPQLQQQQQILSETNVLKYGSSPDRPAIIRRGSSILLSKKRVANAEPQREGIMSQSKRIKSESNAVFVTASDNNTTTTTTTTIGNSNASAADKTAAIEAAAAASVMADMKNNKKPITTSPTLSGEKAKVEDDTSSNGYPKLHAVPPPHSHQQHHLPPSYQNFHPGVGPPPPFHPHVTSFVGGHPFGYHPMAFHGYPHPHGPPVTVPSSMVGPQYHGHPGAGFYPSYYSGFHSPILNQHNVQHLPTFGSPYQNLPAATALPSLTVSSNNGGTTNGEEKDRSKHGTGIIPSISVRSNSTSTTMMKDQSINSSSSSKGSCNTVTDGNSPSCKRCVPLQEPIPSKHWGKDEKTKNLILPDFHRLVNFPDYLSKSRGFVPGGGDTSASGGCSKAVSGKKNCVMCGKLRICSASSLTEKGRPGGGGGINTDGDDGHIIPRQNKGLCTACDVAVWVVMADGMEIKWCKGCKNFRHWAAFGDKGSATKCVRCRHRQKEKYAKQKEVMRVKRNTKRGVTEGIQSSSLKTSLSTNHTIGYDEKKEDETYLAAARGLRSLMNAATGIAK
jgi:hypothetical protein